MKIVILGAGIIGAMTAYRLHRAGAQVTIIDRRPAAGSECSFANGGQLSYAHCEPWCAPGVPSHLPLWTLTPGAPFSFHKADRHFPAWGRAFLASCRKTTFAEGRAAMADLGALSSRALHAAAADTGIAFARRSAGIFHLARTSREYHILLSQAKAKTPHGIAFEPLTREQAATRFHINDSAGGIFYPDDETGDVRECCAGLIRYLQERGVRCLFNTPVYGLHRDGDSIVGVTSDTGVIEKDADAYILCAGAQSGYLAASAGLHLPVYPVKGYSVTYTIPPGMRDNIALCGITDQRHKIVYSRLHHLLRAAGMADIDGYDTGIRRRRIRALRKHCETLFPFCKNTEPVHEWACLRPFLPDGIPAIGYSGLDKCYINTGHGSLGWTMAAGSAVLLERMMNRLPSPLSEPFCPQRFTKQPMV